MEKEQLSEKLLDGWLAMSLSISNERLVSAMTFNESMVCNLLYRQQKRDLPPLNATELCSRLQILKPQMNVILNRLEEGGIIRRTRSEADKRNVEIRLTEKGIPIYENAHREILQMPMELIRRLGEEKIEIFAAMMKEVAACFDEMMQDWKGKENRS